MTKVGQFTKAWPGLREGPICSESSQSYISHAVLSLLNTHDKMRESPCSSNADKKG